MITTVEHDRIAKEFEVMRDGKAIAIVTYGKYGECKTIAEARKLANSLKTLTA